VNRMASRAFLEKILDPAHEELRAMLDRNGGPLVRPGSTMKGPCRDGDHGTAAPATVVPNGEEPIVPQPFICHLPVPVGNTLPPGRAESLRPVRSLVVLRGAGS